MSNLKDAAVVAKQYQGNLRALKDKIRAVQSKKCMLKKRKSVENYEQAMAEILAEEQVLKEARELLDPHDRKVTEYTEADVQALDYDSARKALRSIQSTKCLTSSLAEDKGRYENALKIEKMIKARLEEVKPIEDGLIKKKELIGVIDAIKTGHKMKTEDIVKMLEELL